jgi:hypothetical protein
MTTKRSDCHRPGAIIPAHYQYVLSYELPSMSGGWPIPAFNIDNALALRPVPVGGLGKCSVCGANFSHGDVWKHEPTGEYIHLGYDCAAKYDMMADRSAHELAYGRVKAAAAVAIKKQANEDKRQAFLNAHPGLEKAFTYSHRIIVDIKERFTRDCEISEKQVALVLKIANDIENPRAEETKVEAPTGKKTFRGVVVSTKVQEGAYGNSIKCVVKVQAEGGVWLAWGTVPANILNDNNGHKAAVKGSLVEITATLKPGREKGFAVMGRPAGKILKQACDIGTCYACAKPIVEGVVTFLRAGSIESDPFSQFAK